MSDSMPERPTLAGDWTDDDGSVFDALVEPQANPLPVPAQVMTEAVTGRPVRTDRLMSGTATYDPAWAPILLMPADAYRTSITVQNNSATATDGLRVADDFGKCMGAVGAGLVYPANPLVLRNYTGPVWVSAAGAAAAVSVSFWSVTE